MEYLEFENDGGYSDLNHFKNLTIVHCNRIMRISLDLMKSLIELPNLVELHCNSLSLINLGDYHPPESELERRKILFNHFSQQIKVLKLYFEGVLIEVGKQFDDYNFGQDIWSLHMRHYDSLADCIPWRKIINFRDLNQQVKSRSTSLKNIQISDGSM